MLDAPGDHYSEEHLSKGGALLLYLRELRKVAFKMVLPRASVNTEQLSTPI